MLTNGRATIVSATVTCRRVTGRWTVSIIVEAADLHPAACHPSWADGDAGGWVGVDRGLAAFVVAACADGSPVLRVDDPPRPLRAGITRLRQLSRRVSRKQKGSANRRKAVCQLSRQHRRIRNIRHEFLHTVARRLVKTHDRLVLEDLNITGMTANHRLAAAISDAAWAELARIICYQQAWRGGQVMFADRWYPSTKTCSRCGTLAPAVPLSVRVFGCAACGLVLDRDLNAAVNLATWAEQHARVRDPQAGGPVTNAYRETVHPPARTRG
jgi:putative transposase